jgi:hypothetical protein
MHLPIMGSDKWRIPTFDSEQSASVGSSEKEASEGVLASSGTIQTSVHAEKRENARRNPTPNGRKME